MREGCDSNDVWLRRLFAVEGPDATFRPGNSPLVVARASGSLVWDVAGREYIDLCAGFGALPLGHNDKSVILQSIAQGPQAEIVTGLGDLYPSVAKIELLETLVAATPDHISAGLLAVTGSQAVEIALKTAHLVTGRSRWISFVDGYHGLDLGVLPVLGMPYFAAPFSPIGSPPSRKLAYGCERSDLRAALGGGDVAAVIVEPIQGRGGIVVPPEGWLAMLREETAQVGTLLVADEVMTGAWRTGPFLASAEVRADLVCVGKAIGGGMPVSACLGTAEVMRAWPECPGAALHTGTFFGHPLSCRVGVATLRELAARSVGGPAVQAKGKAFAENLVRRLPQESYRAIRGEGLFLGIDFATPGFAARLMDELRASGVLAIPAGAHGQVLSLTPALNIPDPLLEVFVDRLAEAVAVCRTRGSRRRDNA